MTIRVGINGFGRIGRLVMRAAQSRQDIEIVGINDLLDPDYIAYLLKYDSTHGIFDADVSVDNGHLIVNGKKIRVTSERDPAQLNWSEVDADVVVESTGLFLTKETASKHIEAGAKKVVMSAPSKDDTPMFVMGVNHDSYAGESIVSNASCTTNCLAPVAKVLQDNFGIKTGYMTTIHSYTGDQPSLDTMHKDHYRARAASLSMIPTSTGAAKAVSLVMPELEGKMDGAAIRVPTPNVSCVDLKFLTDKPATVDEINKAIKEAAHGNLKGILGYDENSLVSIDFNHSSESSTFAAQQTKVLPSGMSRILSWYDNEWGFSNRMADTAVAMGALL